MSAPSTSNPSAASFPPLRFTKGYLSFVCSVPLLTLHIESDILVTHVVNLLPNIEPLMCFFGFRANALLLTLPQSIQDAHVIRVNCGRCAQPSQAYPEGCHRRFFSSFSALQYLVTWVRKNNAFQALLRDPAAPTLEFLGFSLSPSSHSSYISS